MNEISTLPPYEAKSFMCWIAEATEAYFENPETKKRFEKWIKERKQDGENTTA